MDTIVRTIVDVPEVQSPPEPEIEVPKDNKDTSYTDFKEIEPIDIRESSRGDMLLEALGVQADERELTADDKANLTEVKTYIKDLVKAKGLSPTVGAFKKTLDSIKGEMGLDNEADPAIVLQRVSGVIKSWKNLAFVTDPIEKRKIFMKLARLPSAEAMNKEVFDLMTKYEVWQ